MMVVQRIRVRTFALNLSYLFIWREAFKKASHIERLAIQQLKELLAIAFEIPPRCVALVLSQNPVRQLMAADAKQFSDCG